MKFESLTQLSTVTLGDGLCNPVAKGEPLWEKPVKRVVQKRAESTIQDIIAEYEEIAELTRSVTEYISTDLAFTALPKDYFSLKVDEELTIGNC